MAKSEKVTVKLNHYSHLEGAEGIPGSIVEVDAKQAEAWINDKAAEWVEVDAKQAPEPSKNGQKETEKKPEKPTKDNKPKTLGTPAS